MTFLPFFLKYLLMPLLLVVAVVIGWVVKKQGKILSLRKAIFFVLLTALLLALPSLFCMAENEYMPGYLFFTYVIHFFMGILIYFFIDSNYFKTIGVSDRKHYIFVMLAIMCLLTAWLSMTVFNWLSTLDYGLWVGLSSFMVMVPILADWTYKAFLKIELPLYKTWSYGVSSEADWDKYDFRYLMGVHLSIKRNPGEPKESVLNVRAPNQMPIGQWFQKFITDHNKKFPQTPILTENEVDVFEWSFYMVRYIFIWTPLDPDLSFLDNGLKDNAKIIAKRATSVQIN
jgi:hypothetical protein